MKLLTYFLASCGLFVLLEGVEHSIPLQQSNNGTFETIGFKRPQEHRRVKITDKIYTLQFDPANGVLTETVNRARPSKIWGPGILNYYDVKAVEGNVLLVVLKSGKVDTEKLLEKNYRPLQKKVKESESRVSEYNNYSISAVSQEKPPSPKPQRLVPARLSKRRHHVAGTNSNNNHNTSMYRGHSVNHPSGGTQLLKARRSQKSESNSPSYGQAQKQSNVKPTSMYPNRKPTEPKYRPSEQLLSQNKPPSNEYYYKPPAEEEPANKQPQYDSPHFTSFTPSLQPTYTNARSTSQPRYTAEPSFAFTQFPGQSSYSPVPVQNSYPPSQPSYSAAPAQPSYSTLDLRNDYSEPDINSKLGPVRGPNYPPDIRRTRTSPLYAQSDSTRKMNINLYDAQD